MIEATPSRPSAAFVLILKAIGINLGAVFVFGLLLAPTDLRNQLWILAIPAMPILWSVQQMITHERRGDRLAAWFAFVLSLILPLVIAFSERGSL